MNPTLGIMSALTWCLGLLLVGLSGCHSLRWPLGRPLLSSRPVSTMSSSGSKRPCVVNSYRDNWSYCTSFYSLNTQLQATASDNDCGNSDDIQLKWVLPGYRRPLHWVFKIGSLEANVAFFRDSFNFDVFRHEEFESGCEATCNGPYGGAWSKTMIGYGGSEQEAFALELTYNYGIDSYLRGIDLRYLSMFRSAYQGPSDAIISDANGNSFIQTPDDYWIHLVDGPRDTTSRFQYPFAGVSLHTSNLTRSIDFYTRVLGARQVTSLHDLQGLIVDPHAVEDGRAAVFTWQFGDQHQALAATTTDSDTTKEYNTVFVELVQLPPNITVDRALAPGRLAIETEDNAPAYMADRLLMAQKGQGSSNNNNDDIAKVLHGPIKLQPHGEEVVIIQDHDGHEYCFVDARGFNTCTNVALKEGGNKIDWKYRQALEDAAMAKMESSPDFNFGPFIHRSSLLAIDEDLNSRLNSSGTDVVLEVYARWCDVCLFRKPVLQEVARTISQRTDLSVRTAFIALDGSSKRVKPITSVDESDCEETCNVDDDDEEGIDPDSSSQLPRALSSAVSSVQLMTDWAKLNGYPALFLLKGSDPTAPIYYDGDWDVESMTSWIVSHQRTDNSV